MATVSTVCNSDFIDEETINSHYGELMCLKKTKFGPKTPKNRAYLEGCTLVEGREGLIHVCVLPKGHTGKCAHTFNIFKSSKLTKQIKTRAENAIYSTPGNDDYVFKNRASRLFQFALCDEEGRRIRDKRVKKKCAIPLKDASTPHHLAHAFLDWWVFLYSVPEIRELMKTDELNAYFDKHKAFLVKHFAKFNRKIFDDEGNAICVITRHKLTVRDVADITRDMRKNYSDNDLQMGHNVSRSDAYATIRGCNLLPMTRRGNLVIGEKKFTENEWIEELRSILSPYM